MVIYRLKETRENMNLKQNDLAKLFHVHFTTISGWETGNDTIPLKHLIFYSNYFQYSLDYLFGITKQNTIYNDLQINLDEIGKNLRTIRKNNNLTLKQIALQLNCDLSTYAHYEEGKHLISTTFLYALKDIYPNLSFDELLGREKSKKN